MKDDFKEFVDNYKKRSSKSYIKKTEKIRRNIQFRNKNIIKKGIKNSRNRSTINP